MSYVSINVFAWKSLSSDRMNVSVECDGLKCSGMTHSGMWADWSQVATFHYLDKNGGYQFFDACRKCNAEFVMRECAQQVQTNRSQEFRTKIDDRIYLVWNNNDDEIRKMNDDRQSFQMSRF